MTFGTPPAVVRERAVSRQWGALHALHCFGVVRSRMDSERFGIMVQRGFAKRKFDGPRCKPDQCDYVITPNGKDMAFRLF